MKKILLLFTAIFSFGPNAFSQSNPTTGSFNISVVMPVNSRGLDESQLSMLETKIIRIVESSGIVASGYYSDFVIYPKFEIYETNSVEGGMQNIVMTSSQLSLFIKQLDNNLIFSSITKTLKGSGNNTKTSITNAISSLNVHDKELKQFVDLGKGKILEYYNTKCSAILAKADNFTKKNEFEQAIATIASIPEGTTCYSLAQVKSVAVYKLYQNARCAEIIKQINVSLATNDYSAALALIAEIDPSSSCLKEALTFLKKIESNIAAGQKREYDLKVKMYNDKVALQKYRISAIKDIAVAYFKNRPIVNYNLLVF